MSFVLRRQSGVNLIQEPTNPFEGYGIKECDELAKIYADLSSAIERIYPKMNVWCIDPFIDYLNRAKEYHYQIDELKKQSTILTK